MVQLRQAPVAQLDRVFDYESKGRGFESLLACQRKDVYFDADSVEVSVL